MEDNGTSAGRVESEIKRLEMMLSKRSRKLIPVRGDMNWAYKCLQDYDCCVHLVIMLQDITSSAATYSIELNN